MLNWLKKSRRGPTSTDGVEHTEKRRRTVLAIWGLEILLAKLSVGGITQTKPKTVPARLQRHFAVEQLYVVSFSDKCIST